MSSSSILGLLLVVHPALYAATDFHVAPTGSDKNPGTEDKPFQTLAHARNEVARINSKMNGDITVHLANGIYPLTEPLVLDANDSGMNGHKVIYKALPGHEPVISGGSVIKGWQLHDKDKNIYKASVGDRKFRQIYVDGKRAIRARHPNREDEVTLGPYLVGGGVTGKPPYQFKVNPAELKGWEGWSHLNEVEVVMVTHWKQKSGRIAGIQGDLISFHEPENAARSMNHFEQPGTPHFYENCYEFLDAGGEFYLNTRTDTLYYKPRIGEDLNSAEVVVPTVETLIDLKGESADNGVHDLMFDGITFEYSNWTGPSEYGFQTMQSATWYSDAGQHFVTNLAVPAAIQLHNARGVEIRGCTVRHTGAHAIAAIKDVVSDCSFVGNHISDTAAGGIYLLLNDAASSGHRITDNAIEHVGRCYSNGCGILVARTPDVSILHNEISHVRYTGISTGWSWDDKDSAARNHDVGHNHIHDVMQLHDDGGGIYTLGKIPGMKIHHNHIHDLKRSKFAGSYGICGIYLDNGSCLKLVQDNVIGDVEAAFFSGNKPNYQNTFDRNYHNGPLAKIIEKTNTVTNNTKVEKSAWPAKALKIMKEAGPRQPYSCK